MSKITTVLIVEDDAKIRSLLANVMDGEGFEVIEACNAKAAIDTVRTKGIDLVTMDIHLGGDDGISAARAIRAFSNVPIIMVTGKDDVIDRVVGLEVGADDYITKPFHIRELLARVRSVLRRYQVTQAAAVNDTSMPGGAGDGAGAALLFDGMRAIPDQFELYDRNGARCALTSGDFRLLNVFLQHPKRVLSRDQLMDLTGGMDWTPLDRTIDNQVARLRKKIEKDPSDPLLIKTVRGVGYMFACNVELVQPSLRSA